jgi:hypothetical protein
LGSALLNRSTPWESLEVGWILLPSRVVEPWVIMLGACRGSRLGWVGLEETELKLDKRFREVFMFLLLLAF